MAHARAMAETSPQTANRPFDADAIARAHAVYTPSALAVYDLVVHGLSNRFAWLLVKIIAQLYGILLRASRPLHFRAIQTQSGIAGGRHPAIVF